MQLKDVFHHEFASFKMGMVKPDLAIYERVISELVVEPEQVLFMDDNQGNIDTTLKAGMAAVRTQGIGEVKTVLNQRLPDVCF